MRFITLSLILIGLLMTTTATRAADEPTKVLKHIVMYKFHDTLTEARQNKGAEQRCQGRRTKVSGTVCGQSCWNS